MMKRLRAFACALFFGFALTAGAVAQPSQSAPSANTEPLARKVMNNYVRPAYAQLSDAAEALKSEMAAFCPAPSAAGRSAINAAFERALLAWSRAEMIRFGPVLAANAHDRFAFWPDEKGLGLKQINAALTARDETAATAEALAGKSVAVQGYTALEYLLYGTGADTLLAATDEGRYRCRFAAAIAGNIASLAAQVKAAWADDAPFPATLLSPKPEHSLYKSSRDVKLELFKAFTTGLQHIRDVKLARVLADGPDKAQPKRAPYWRSGLTFKVIEANLEALEIYFNRGGYSELIAVLQPGIEKSVAIDLARMRETLRALETTPVETAVKSKDGWSRLNGVIFELVTVQQTGGGAIARAADISLGFNALDGD